MHNLWVALLLAVCSVNICYAKHIRNKKHHHSDCFSEERLQNSPLEVVDHFFTSKMHWDRYPAVTMVKQLESTEKKNYRRRRTAQATCPQLNTIINGKALNERSISPWTYRIDTDESRYPQKLAFAHCLCEHCIGSKGETSSLNSVPIQQTMLVLRKKNCPHDPTLSTFIMEYIHVPVACTCAAPRY